MEERLVITDSKLLVPNCFKLWIYPLGKRLVTTFKIQNLVHIIFMGKIIINIYSKVHGQSFFKNNTIILSHFYQFTVEQEL